MLVWRRKIPREEHKVIQFTFKNMILQSLSQLLKHTLIWAIAAAMITPVLAADATAPRHIESELAAARLSGQGSFRWFGLKIYDAQLWVSDKGYRSDAPTASKLALDLRYARSLQGEKIAEASEEEMRKLNMGSLSQRANWQAQMAAIFPDVEDGTHLTGIYLPKEGVRFYLNGKIIGDIMDPEFAHAFFAIWLAPGTTASQLRTALLTGAAPR